ncbi:MAG: phosphate acyltransferase PlsX [Clostridia bacterium]|nr:phosphate acyltransferase PlsX [Clostridia bacterium]
MNKQKILIDAFGCDNPDAVIDGIGKALNQIDNVNLVVSGDKDYIENRLKGVEFDRSRLEILDAKEVITNDDSPVIAVRQKKQSSLVVGYTALKNRTDLSVMITAGNTGAVIAGAILVLGRESRDDRPFLATFLPNDKGGVTCLADCGANVDCRPEHLLTFAQYASEYTSRMYDVEKPIVKLLSVGTEDKKGNNVTKEAFELLKNSRLNFCGNIEAKAVLSGEADVVIADGFNGNVLLKSIEGTVKSVCMRISALLKKNADSNADLGFVKTSFGELMQTLDFNSMGGALLLGVKKPIIKAHGSANSDTVVNTVKQAMKIIESNKN